MKSTQDLCVWMRDLAKHLRNDELALVITIDKNFEIVDTSKEEATTLFNGGDNNLDINDLPYTDTKVIAKEIKDYLLVKDIRADEL